MSTEETAREHPYEPEPGEVVHDAATRKVGRVMDRMGSRVQLRPLNGGREWDALPSDLRPAAQSDAMSEAVAEANALSRRGRCDVRSPGW
ncbi:hypothetical protein ACIBCM_32350 [Streptomyces sp. NPDC051018]|uniref:hypothetical protein n=1 Tax=Streptomyces sp. NPDC051018 TaxID=3365639 RepID=UPI0037B28898